MKKLHHMTIKKMEREIKELERKLDYYEESANFWLPEGLVVGIFQEYGIYNPTEDEFLESTEGFDDFEAFKINKALDMVGAMNIVYERYKKLIKEYDEIER